MHPRTLQALQGIEASRKLNKLAEVFRDDEAVLEKIAVAKVLLDDELFSLAKTAAPWGELLQQAGKKVGKGALYGLGGGIAAAAPLAGVGAYYQNKATEGAKEISADIRNKVLQAALGLTGIGAGAYGLHKLMGGETPDVKGLISGFAENQKKASDRSAELADAIEKLATVGVVEGLLDQLPATASDDTKKLAAEVRVLNRGYGMQLLSELMDV